MYNHIHIYKSYLIAQMSDLHKDIYGIRPRWMYNEWHNMSVSDLHKEYDTILEDYDNNFENRQEE